MSENIEEFLKSLNNKYSDKVALQIRKFFRTEKYTYSDLYKLTHSMISFYSQQGVKVGDTVLIWAPNSPEWVIVFLGSLLSGVVVVPVGLHTTSELIEKYISQTNPKILFCSSFLPVEVNSGIKKVFLEDLIDLLEVQTIDNTYKSSPTILAEIVFTSGTTGEPKGVMITNENIFFSLEQILKSINYHKEY